MPFSILFSDRMVGAVRAGGGRGTGGAFQYPLLGSNGWRDQKRKVAQDMIQTFSILFSDRMVGAARAFSPVPWHRGHLSVSSSRIEWLALDAHAHVFGNADLSVSSSRIE